MRVGYSYIAYFGTLKKLKQILGITTYQRKVTDEAGITLGPKHVQISAAADEELAADTKEVIRQKHQRSLKAREEADKEKEPSGERVITDDVHVNFFALVWAVGQEGELDKRLNKGKHGILKHLLGNTKGCH